MFLLESTQITSCGYWEMGKDQNCLLSLLDNGEGNSDRTDRIGTRKEYGDDRSRCRYNMDECAE
jgi:hypothetical protein